MTTWTKIQPTHSQAKEDTEITVSVKVNEYLSIRSKVKPDFMETIIYLHSPFFSIAIYFEVNGNGRKYRDKKWYGSTKDSHIMIYFVKNHLTFWVVIVSAIRFDSDRY